FVSDDAEDRDGRRDQRGHDGPANEELGNVHVAFPFSFSFSLPFFRPEPSPPLPALPATGAPSGVLISTGLPGTTRSCPSVTTVSPAIKPFVTTASSCVMRSTATLRNSAMLSGFTTKTC